MRINPADIPDDKVRKWYENNRLVRFPLQKIILVVGSGRCGTSWVLRWLLRHPDVYGFRGESKFFEFLTPLIDPQNTHIPYNCKRSMPLLGSIDRQQLLRLTGKFAHDIFSSLVERKDETILAEKTPRHFWLANAINDIFREICEVKFIHIYRDGRNVLESFERQEWYLQDMIEATAIWMSMMQSMIDKKYPDNMFHIKYEDLISDTSMSRLITDFCGVNHHHDIRAFEQMEGPGCIKEHDPERWKRLLQTPGGKACLDKMRPILKRLGYG